MGEGGGVNFFKLYIGDYQRDTAHLSITEHGAYMLMLQHYYATEKPLPIGKALHRMLRATDKAERDAIDAVAAQFWTTTEAGLVNERADRELTKADAQAETNRRIANEREAARKAAREQHEKSTNRGKKNSSPAGSDDEKQREKSLESARNQEVDAAHNESEGITQVVDFVAAASTERGTNRSTIDQPNQTPDTRHQTPEEKTEKTARGARLLPDWVLPEEWRDWAQQERPDLDPQVTAERFRDYWTARPGAGGRKLDWQATWRNWVREERAAPPLRAVKGAEPEWRREQRERNEAFAGPAAAKRKAEPQQETIDVAATRLG